MVIKIIIRKIQQLVLKERFFYPSKIHDVDVGYFGVSVSNFMHLALLHPIDVIEIMKQEVLFCRTLPFIATSTSE
jgi:hypothetical protein